MEISAAGNRRLLSSTINRWMKYLSGKTLQPVVARYVAKQREYNYHGLTIQIPPQVFHPGLFFSTKQLLKYILSLDIDGKNFLELGAGSGLIAMSAARRGAWVLATDINRIAVDYLRKNQQANHLHFPVIVSDLFRSIPRQSFDIIAINPPYYKKNPVSEREYAWYCGLNGEYFVRLFETMGDYTTATTEVYMILSDECDIDMIKDTALKNGYRFTLADAKKRLWETNYIFKIEEQ